MANAQTVEFLRKTTDTLIEYEPTMVQLTHPPEMIPNGRGGLTPSGTSTAEDAPVARFFSQTTPQEIVSIKSEGREVVVNWVLVGPYGDDIREGDTFTVDGVEYKVWVVHDDKRWQTKGLVSRA